MTLSSKLFPIISLLFLAICSSLTLFSVGYLFNIPFDPLLILTLGGITLSIYGINKFTDTEDILNDPRGVDLFRKNRIIFFIAIISGLGSIFILSLTNKLTAVHIAIIFIGIAYSIKLIPWFGNRGDIEFFRIKDILFGKSLAVSLSLGTGIFGVIWAIYPENITYPNKVLLFMVSGFLFCFSNTNFCDIRDVVGDKTMKIPTLPVRFGIKNTIKYALIIPNIIWLIIISYFLFSNKLSIAEAAFFFINALYPGIYLFVYTKKYLDRHKLTMLADASLIVFSVTLIFLRLAEPAIF